jgi:hypothetical protein
MFDDMIVDFTVDVLDLQAQEELYDWYADQMEGGEEE